MKVGDTVRYSVNFLRSISCYTGPMACSKGIITALEPFGSGQLAVVDWQGEDLPRKILSTNLTVKGSAKERLEAIQ